VAQVQLVGASGLGLYYGEAGEYAQGGNQGLGDLPRHAGGGLHSAS